MKYILPSTVVDRQYRLRAKKRAESFLLSSNEEVQAWLRDQWIAFVNPYVVYEVMSTAGFHVPRLLTKSVPEHMAEVLGRALTFSEPSGLPDYLEPGDEVMRTASYSTSISFYRLIIRSDTNLRTRQQ